MASSEYEFDTSRLPIIVVTLPARLTLDVVHRAFDRFAELGTKHSRIAWVNDCRSLDAFSAPPVIRKAIALRYQKNRPKIARSTVCECRVFSSSVAYGFSTAIDWLTSSDWPRANFMDMVTAEKWADEKLHGRTKTIA